MLFANADGQAEGVGGGEQRQGCKTENHPKVDGKLAVRSFSHGALELADLVGIWINVQTHLDCKPRPPQRLEEEVSTWGVGLAARKGLWQELSLGQEQRGPWKQLRINWVGDKRDPKSPSLVPTSSEH